LPTLASEHLPGLTLAISRRECRIGATALGRFFDSRIDLPQPLVEIRDGVSLDFDTSRNGWVLRRNGRLYRTSLVHMGGPEQKVRLLATTWRAIERIAPGRQKRGAANYTGAMLHPALAPKVPHVAILAKAAGVCARRFALVAKALALTLLTVQGVAIAAKAAGVYALQPAFDAKALPVTALTFPHVTI
jgi:hypothetical protein